MRVIDGKRLYSASDLVNFLGCNHCTALDLRQLVSPVELPPDDQQAVLLQQKGMVHERSYLDGERFRVAKFDLTADAFEARLRADDVAVNLRFSHASEVAKVNATLEALCLNEKLLEQAALTHHEHLCAIAKKVCPDVQLHRLP
jgi:hypothetical protein